jgi:hypothetical protein
MNPVRTVLLMLLASALLFIAGASAADVEGTIKLGGVIVDEDAGDLSVMQETYNVYEGFSATQLRLNGNLDPRTYFTLSLNDINLDSRKSDFQFWVPGRFRFFARYDQHRQVFDPDRVLNSRRKDLRFGAWTSPAEWLSVSADYSRQTRKGERLGFPLGAASSLGSGYDDVLHTGRVEGELRGGPRALAVAYDFSSYAAEGVEAGDRSGYVVSGRVRTPCYFTDKITHMIRAAYGRRELSNLDTHYTLQNFQYTGVALPVPQVQLKYNFYASRIDDRSTTWKTDNFRNNFDAAYFCRHGSVFGGYGYETNDDDRSLTSYHTYRIGGSARGPRKLTAKVEFANRTKKDTEKLTLLEDIETATLTAKLQATPARGMTVGAAFKDRQREYADIGVESTGRTANVYGSYSYSGWGSVGVEYTWSRDEYDNRIDRYDAESNAVTSRASFDRVRGVRLGGGVTYLDVGRDLDIEKSILFLEGEFTLREDYHVEVKYNVYNYDDYVLLDRYYTANVVWINVAYDFDFQKD